MNIRHNATGCSFRLRASTELLAVCFGRQACSFLMLLKKKGLFFIAACSLNCTSQEMVSILITTGRCDHWNVSWFWDYLLVLEEGLAKVKSVRLWLQGKHSKAVDREKEEYIWVVFKCAASLFCHSNITAVGLKQATNSTVRSPEMHFNLWGPVSAAIQWLIRTLKNVFTHRLVHLVQLDITYSVLTYARVWKK